MKPKTPTNLKLPWFNIEHFYQNTILANIKKLNLNYERLSFIFIIIYYNNNYLNKIMQYF